MPSLSQFFSNTARTWNSPGSHSSSNTGNQPSSPSSPSQARHPSTSNTPTTPSHPSSSSSSSHLRPDPSTNESNLRQALQTRLHDTITRLDSLEKELKSTRGELDLTRKRLRDEVRSGDERVRNERRERERFMDEMGPGSSSYSRSKGGDEGERDEVGERVNRLVEMRIKKEKDEMESINDSLKRQIERLEMENKELLKNNTTSSTSRSKSSTTTTTASPSTVSSSTSPNNDLLSKEYGLNLTWTHSDLLTALSYLHPTPPPTNINISTLPKSQLLPTLFQSLSSLNSQTISPLRSSLKSNEQELIKSREKINELKQSLYESEDLAKISHSLLESSHSQLSSLESSHQFTLNSLKSTQSQLDTLVKEVSSRPLGWDGLVKELEILNGERERLRECLTCPMCYEGLKKEEWASLRCGHVFCVDCLNQYSKSHRETWKTSPNTMGPYPGPDCPECRLPVFSSSPSPSNVGRRENVSPFEKGHPGLGSGKWRVWMLEEVVRMLSKGEEREEDRKKGWGKNVEKVLKDDGNGNGNRKKDDVIKDLKDGDGEEEKMVVEKGENEREEGMIDDGDGDVTLVDDSHQQQQQLEDNTSQILVEPSNEGYNAEASPSTSTSTQRARQNDLVVDDEEEEIYNELARRGGGRTTRIARTTTMPGAEAEEDVEMDSDDSDSLSVD